MIRLLLEIDGIRKHGIGQLVEDDQGLKKGSQKHRDRDRPWWRWRVKSSRRFEDLLVTAPFPAWKTGCRSRPPAITITITRNTDKWEKPHKTLARLHNLVWDQIRTIKLIQIQRNWLHKQTTEALSHRLPAKPIKKGFPYSHLAPTCPSIQRRAPCESHPPPPSSSSC